MDSETKEQLERMCERIRVLEFKVDKLVIMMERSLGAWLVIKVIGSAAIGATALWAFFSDHIHLR